MTWNRRQRVQYTQFFSFLSILVSWGMFFYVLILIPPHIWESIGYAPFFLVLGISISITVKGIFHSWVWAGMTSLGVIGILILRMLQFRAWYYPVLIGGIVSTLGYFFTLVEEKQVANE